MGAHLCISKEDDIRLVVFACVQISSSKKRMSCVGNGYSKKKLLLGSQKWNWTKYGRWVMKCFFFLWILMLRKAMKKRTKYNLCAAYVSMNFCFCIFVFLLISYYISLEHEFAFYSLFLICLNVSEKSAIWLLGHCVKLCLQSK